MAAQGSSEAADRELVGAYLAGADEAAFGALYRRHAPLLYGLALRLTAGRRAEADDVLQETWIRALSGLRGFRWESALSTWLCGIAVRCARELRRAEGAPTAPDRDAGTVGGALDLDLDRAIAALAPGYREVLLLHDVYGYTHAEIGALLEIEPGTSKSQLTRARRAAREKLRGGLKMRRTFHD